MSTDRIARIASAALVVVLLASCSSGPVDSGSTVAAAAPTTTTTVATTVTTTTMPMSSGAERTITVNALGHAHGTPDSLTVSMGLEVFGASTGEVITTLSDKGQALISFLTQYGIPPESIQTTYLSAYPTYGNNAVPSGMPTITGYVANLNVDVRVADLETAAPMLDGAAYTVGNTLRLQGLSWSIADSDPLLATARTDAMDRARVQAEQIATASGLELGDIVSVEESTTQYPYSNMSMGGEGLPINPGGQILYAQVKVVFAARQP